MLVKPIHILGAALFSISFCAAAQARHGVNEGNASIGIGIRDGNLTLAAFRYWPIDKRQRSQIGLGIPYTGYLGNNQDFITAPASLVSSTIRYISRTSRPTTGRTSKCT